MELTIEKALQQGVAAHREGKLQEAERLYRAILQYQPAHPDANHNLGVIAVLANKADTALQLFKTALEAKPNVERYWLSYVETLVETGQLETAESAVQMAADKGVNTEKLEAILDQLEFHTVTQEPSQAQFDAILEHYQKGRHLEAEKLASLLTQEFPQHAFGYKALGVVLRKLGRVNEAILASQKSIELAPGDTEAHSNLGNALQDLGRLDEAESSFKQAIALKPDSAEAHNNLGNTLQELRRLDEAEARYKQALVLKHDYVEAHNNLGNTLRELGRFDDAEASYYRALELSPDYAKARSNLLFLNASIRFDASRYLAEARNFADAVAKQISSPHSTWSCSRSPTLLRVGFVSGDFKSHPVGYFLEGLLAQLGSSSIELYAYSTNNPCGAFTDRLKALFNSWKSLAGKSDKDAAQTIHNDGVHILIDLSGHTGQNRLAVFGWRPAPIQITWLGYFASTGLPEMDYILGDPFVTPHSEAHHFTEKIWQLPESFLCFTPPSQDLAVSPLPALSNGFITFGCFNQLHKMTDEVVSVRSKILHAVPDSKLLLNTLQLRSQLGRDRVLSRFAAHGISSDRLLLECTTGRGECLPFYSRVDIALSPFPYGGGTNSVEGLWMGVPVIAIKGNYFLSHVGESIAHNSNLSDWIAEDSDDYIAKAVEFSSDLSALKMLRQSLRENLLKTPLFDLPRFANHFEKALWEMKGSINE